MKKMLTRTWQSGIALLMAICLAVGLCPTVAFAQENAPKKKYVSLGDSMTNGLGLGNGYDENSHNGYNEVCTLAYPSLVAEEFKWELTQLATSAMRAEDLHYILEYGTENAYQGDEWTKGELMEHSNRWANTDATTKFQSSIKEADVVSMAVGNANFGVYLMDMITTTIGLSGYGISYDYCTLDNALEMLRVDEETKAIVKMIYAKMLDYADDYLPAEMADTLANRIAYVVTSYMINFEGALDRIVELNPDVEIIIVGLMNTMSGYELNIINEDGTTHLDMAAMLDIILNPMNAYLAGLPTVKQGLGQYAQAKLYYAELDRLETHSKTFKEVYQDEENLIRDRFVKTIVGTESEPGLVWDVLDQETFIKLSDITGYEAAVLYKNDGGEEVARNEQEQILGILSYMQTNSNIDGFADKVTAVVTYLTLENAILSALEQDADVNLDDIVMPEGGFNLMNLIAANMEPALNDQTIVEPAYAEKYEAVLDVLAETYVNSIISTSDSSSAYTKEQVIAAIKNASSSDSDNTLYFYQVLAEAAANALVQPVAMAETLNNHGLISALLSLYGRMQLASGMAAHPNANDHVAMTNEVIATYGKHTVQDETIENVEIVLNELYNLLETYGPEAAAQVWAQWEEYGYVDAVETTMTELKSMLSQRYTYYTEIALPTIANSVDALSAQKDALTAELAKLKAELEAKQTELADVINNVEIGSIHTPDINIDVQLGGNEQTEVTGNDCVVDGEGIQAELEAAVKDLEHAIAVIEALIADVEADIADMVALAEQIAAAVEELEKTMVDVAAAAKDLEEAVNQVINVIKNSDGVVNQVIQSFEAARATAQAAVEVLNLTIGTAEEMMADVDVMIEKIAADAEALYNKFMTELPGCIEEIPEEALMLVGGSIMAAQQAYEANKEEINANLQAELAKLAAEYGISEENIRTKLAELAAEYNISEENIRAELAEIEAKITEEVNAKYAEVEAEIGVQIENKKAEAAEKLAALEEELKGYQAELEGLAADAAEEVRKQLQTQIDRVNADIATVNQDLACAIEHLENAAQEAYEQIVAEVTKAYEEAVATLEKQLEELKAAYDKAVAELEKQLEELKKAYDKAVDELTDAADKQIDKLTEELNKQLEELDKIGQALADEINGILTAIREELAGVQKAVEEILKGNLAAVEDLKNALVEMGGEAIVDAVESLKDAVMALIEEATTADLVIDDDFKYVAIGDGSAETESYVEKLAAALNAEADENGVNEIELANYAKVGNTISAERANLSDVTGADLITIGFSNVEFIASAVKAAPGKVEMNWAEVVGAENVHYVDELLAEVAAKIAEAGITGELAEMVNNAIEAYAYAAMVYATELPELVNDIHAINPEALVIIVGMYNPLEGVTIALNQNTTLDISEYIDYLVDGVAVHGIAYSILSGNSIYVDAPAVQTNNTDMELGIMDLTYLILDGFADLYPSAAGDDYIAAEIADALNITYVKPALLGDANSDGVVNIRDAMLVGQYANKQIGANDLNLDVCDVNGDNDVNIRDAMLIGQYANKQITQFRIQ